MGPGETVHTLPLHQGAGDAPPPITKLSSEPGCSTTQRSTPGGTVIPTHPKHFSISVAMVELTSTEKCEFKVVI